MSEFFDAHPWWMLLFFTLGVLASLNGITSLFLSLGRRPHRMCTEEIGAVGSTEFLRPIATLLNVPQREGGTVRLINNGDAWLEQLFTDFDSAQHSINFMAYIWEPGRMSDIVFNKLIERVNAGIEVRV